MPKSILQAIIFFGALNALLVMWYVSEKNNDILVAIAARCPS